MKVVQEPEQADEMVQPLWRTVWGFLTKPDIVLPYGPAIELLGIYPND